MRSKSGAPDDGLGPWSDFMAIGGSEIKMCYFCGGLIHVSVTALAVDDGPSCWRNECAFGLALVPTFGGEIASPFRGHVGG